MMVLLGITLLLTLGALCWLVHESVQRHLLELDTDELNVIADTVSRRLAERGTRSAAAVLEGAVSGHHGVYFEARDVTGAPLYAMPGADLSLLFEGAPAKRILSRGLTRWEDGNEGYRGALVVGADRAMIAVAGETTFHDAYLNELSRVLWLCASAAGLFALGAGWIATHYTHAPIRALARQIKEIDKEDLHHRLNADGVPTELLPIVESFNDLLERLAASFDRLKDFSADVAHELRTPVTNLKTQTEVALSRARSPEEYREVLYSALEEYERMARMIGDMLLLASADRGVLRAEWEAVDLEMELHNLLDYFEAWAEENHVALALDAGPAAVEGDAPMLRRALGNILMNAIRHAARDSTVTIEVARLGSAVAVAITNKGPVIAPEHLGRIFDRFFRADTARQSSGQGTQGSGLGLAIARMIVELHSGGIDVASRDGETCFTVRLPSASGVRNSVPRV